MLYNDVFSAQKKEEGRFNIKSDDLAKDIIDEYKRYVTRLNNHNNVPNFRPHLFNGLVIGNVQSGKTMNFCHVINRAIDEGFQLIVVLSSNKDDLNMQTTDRLADDIVGCVNPSVSQITAYKGNKKGNDFCTFYNNGKMVQTGIAKSSAVNPNMAPNPNHPLVYSGIDIHNRTPEVYWLTACDKGNTGSRKVDFDINRGGGTDSLDTFLQRDPKGCYIAVVKKNTHRLGLLYDFLSNSQTIKSHKIKVLFIDDECDEITVSGKGKKLGKSSVQIDKIQKLFETMPSDTCHSMYIEYTATPIANICVKNRSNTNTGFPDDFIKIMHKSPVYGGFNEYKRYGNITNVINYNQISEVDKMVPGIYNSYINCKIATSQLYKALIQFILNCKIFEERNKDSILSENTTSMLVHTNLTKDVHAVQKDYIDDVLKLMSDELLKELDDIFSNHFGNYVKGNGWNLIDDFYKFYEDTRNKMNICNNNGYYSNNSPFEKCSLNNYPGKSNFDLYLCMDLLSYMLRTIPRKSYNSAIKINPLAKKIQVIEINSNSSCTLRNDENFIAVGGNKIARGLTLHNLSVTYFSRHTGALDTLTQMSRWFGYRIGYFDICRLYIDDYAAIDAAANVERELQHQVRVQNQKNIQSKNMHLIFSESVPNILSGKQFISTQRKFNGGAVFETTYTYLIRGTRNQKVLDDFYKELYKIGYLPNSQGSYGFLNVLPSSISNPKRHCYVSNVNFNIVRKYLLNRFDTVANKQVADQLLLAEEYMKFNNVTKVNVLLSGRDANASGATKTSFANGIYNVLGRASKNKASTVGSNIVEIEPFDDCPEDLVVDYPIPSSLNQDFTNYVSGTIFANNRAPGYVAKLKEFAQRYRKEPLIVITPFEFSNHAGLSSVRGNIYYSIKIIMPNGFRTCNMIII